jgi:antitoxin MazE
MQVLLKRWGNSTAVRLPSKVMEEACLRLDQAVNVRAEGGRIVIEPVRRTSFTLEELVAGITPENLPDRADIDTGAPIGREML